MSAETPTPVPSGPVPASGEPRPPRPVRPTGPGLDGVLVVAKPAGPTSHDIVALVRRLAATKRVGHGGTLDPFATGVLPVFLGRATRLVEFHLGDRKGYRATVCFGASSTTDDLDGELTPIDGPPPGRDAVVAALAAFRGPISQVPPAFSAIKVEGRRAYVLARSGESPTLASRDVTIHRLDLVDWDGSDPDRPIGVLEVDCSAGTYVRALARDLGLALGSAAYLGALTRTASGAFGLEAAHPLETIRAAAASGPAGLEPLLLPIEAGLDRLPRVRLDRWEVEAVARGQFVRPAGGLPGSIPAGDPIIAEDETGRVVAVVRIHGARLAPDKVLVDPPPPAARVAPTDQATPGPTAIADPGVPDPATKRDPVAVPDSDADERAADADERAADADERAADGIGLVEAVLASELDPPTALDPDPASPDEL